MRGALLAAVAMVLLMTAAACSTVSSSAGGSGGVPSGGLPSSSAPAPASSVAASASSAPSPTQAGTAEVRGIVLARPCTGGPESVTESPCPGIAVPGATVVFTAANGSAVTVQTGKDGTFAASLAPGRYTVAVSGRHLFAGSMSLSLEVPVPPSALDSAGLVRLVIDSGLR